MSNASRSDGRSITSARMKVAGSPASAARACARSIAKCEKSMPVTTAPRTAQDRESHPDVLTAARDGDVGDTIGRDVHRSPQRRHLRSADGVKGGRRPSTRTGAKRRPLTPLSTVGEWPAKSGRFVLTHPVARCSFCVSANTDAHPRCTTADRLRFRGHPHQPGRASCHRLGRTGPAGTDGPRRVARILSSMPAGLLPNLSVLSHHQSRLRAPLRRGAGPEPQAEALASRPNRRTWPWESGIL